MLLPRRLFCAIEIEMWWEGKSAVGMWLPGLLVDEERSWYVVAWFIGR
jgi:hypothetical protein